VVFGTDDVSDNQLIEALNPSELRSYEVTLMDKEKLTSKTVRLHLSALSGFCRFLVKEGVIQSNPVRLVPKPKVPKRIPQFYRDETMQEYFNKTEINASQEYLDGFLASPHSKSGRKLYEDRLARLIISMLYSTGLRRSELISLDVSDIDFGRKVAKVLGKGNKLLLKEVARRSKKAEIEAEKIAEEKADWLLEQVCKIYGLKLKEDACEH
jgi:integrase/recombinase XerC